MKTYILLFTALISFQINAQSDQELIEQTIQNYIEGSSYNKVDLLESAFAENATLYLTLKDGFKIITPKEYVSWFKKNEPGKFNGRIGNIISVNVNNDVAYAKAEILIPERNWRFVDLFLLKKFNAGWKIISKTAGKSDSNKKGNRILFVVSNVHFYGDTDISTGNSFSEIVNAFDTFNEAGFTVDFVSPNGGAIPLGYINMSNEMGKKYFYDEDLMYALKNTKSPENINAKNYKAVYYVGGGSTIFDTPSNPAIQKIAMDVYEKNNGIISSVCHGTAGIVHLKTKDGKYLVDGKKVSGYPDDYERTDLPYFKTFPFLIKKTIEERGGKFDFAEKNTPNLAVDGRLVTGQNHLSSRLVALKIIEILNAQ